MLIKSRNFVKIVFFSAIIDDSVRINCAPFSLLQEALSREREFFRPLISLVSRVRYFLNVVIEEVKVFRPISEHTPSLAVCEPALSNLSIGVPTNVSFSWHSIQRFVNKSKFCKVLDGCL